jgi:hypothetical protein
MAGLEATPMREDMYKVIVERPRRGKERDAIAARLRNDLDGPMRLGIRAGYGYCSLNENLAPLRRYLRAQIGRPWNKVFGEICAGIDRRNTVQQHIHQHLRDFIAVDAAVRGGRLVQELYVDPRTGLIRPNRSYRSWRRAAAERRRHEQVEIETRRRRVDEHTLLLLLDDVWFRVEVDVLPKEPRYDVVLRRNISRAMHTDLQQCKHLYGSSDLYATSKRQLSTREIKAHRLRQV